MGRQSYLDRSHVASQRIGAEGLTGRLYATTPQHLTNQPYVGEFVRIMRETSLLSLPGVTLLQRRGDSSACRVGRSRR